MKVKTATNSLLYEGEKNFLSNECCQKVFSSRNTYNSKVQDMNDGRVYSQRVDHPWDA